MRFPSVMRGVLLAAHIGSPVAFTRILLQLQNQDINQTGSRLYRLGSRSGTSNRKIKDGARPQLSNRNWLRAPIRVNDNYCVQSVARLKDSVYVSGKLESFEPFTSHSRQKELDQQERDYKFTCKL